MKPATRRGGPCDRKPRDRTKPLARRFHTPNFRVRGHTRAPALATVIGSSAGESRRADESDVCDRHRARERIRPPRSKEHECRWHRARRCAPGFPRRPAPRRRRVDRRRAKPANRGDDVGDLARRNSVLTGLAPAHSPGGHDFERPDRGRAAIAREGARFYAKMSISESADRLMGEGQKFKPKEKSYALTKLKQCARLVAASVLVGCNTRRAVRKRRDRDARSIKQVTRYATAAVAFEVHMRDLRHSRSEGLASTASIVEVGTLVTERDCGRNCGSRPPESSQVHRRPCD